MDLITQRRCLNALAGGLVLCAFGAGVWSLSSLPQTESLSNGSARVAVSGEQTDSDTSAAEYDPGRLATRLRRPLKDAPKVKPPPAPPVKRVTPPRQTDPPKLNFTLLATIIDAQQSLAVIADSSNNFDYKGVGESLKLSPAGVSIVSIETDQVTLTHNGRESTIKVDKSRKGVARGNARRNNRPGRNN